MAGNAVPRIIARDRAMKKVVDLMERVAGVDSNILIQGESGTGKNFIARCIHRMSHRRDKPFVRIDCTTLPGDLLESELFGHEKGTFTDASDKKIGKFELARGGSVYIERISEISLYLQGKLLRILQEKSFERLGSNTPIEVDIRIMASSGANLRDLVEEGTFRDDLFYRLNVVPVMIPPLRRRPDDIIPLAEHFLKKHSAALDKKFKGLAGSAKSALEEYNWPGNVRELENAVERAVIAGDGGMITEEMLNLTGHLSRKGFLDETARKQISLEELEKRYIKRILDATGGNKSRAAEILGISRKTLLMKRKKYGFD